MFGIAKAYIWNILVISCADIVHILGISRAYEQMICLTMSGTHFDAVPINLLSLMTV